MKRVPLHSKNLLSGETTNNVLDVIERFGGKSPAPIPPPAFRQPATYVLGVNNTGNNLSPGHVVRIGKPVALPNGSTNGNQDASSFFKFDMSSYVELPTDDSSRIGIVSGGIPADINGKKGTGQVIVSGLVSVLLDVKSTVDWAYRAKTVAGQYQRLDSDPAGPIPVVWTESATAATGAPTATGIQWARVLLRAGQGGTTSSGDIVDFVETTDVVTSNCVNPATIQDYDRSNTCLDPVDSTAIWLRVLSGTEAHPISGLALRIRDTLDVGGDVRPYYVLLPAGSSSPPTATQICQASSGFAGYDPSKQQVLTHDSAGVCTWVDVTGC